MAFLELDSASGYYRIRFCYGGRPFKRSLKTRDRIEADGVLGGFGRRSGSLNEGVWKCRPMPIPESSSSPMAS